MINLVGYRVLMTYYYMSSFHMAWIEVWFYRTNKLRKLTDGFYLLKYKAKNHLLLGCVQCTVHTYVNADIYVIFESL